MKAAVLLYENGQSTIMTLIAVDRLNQGLGIRSMLIPSSASLLLIGDDTPASMRVAAAAPVAVNMRRISSAMRTIDRAKNGLVGLDAVDHELNAAASEKFSNTWVFTLACALGAGALAVAFGATNPWVVSLAVVSAAAGGLIRRGLGHFGFGLLPQAFAAATLAGLIGALSVHLHLGGTTELIAVCAGMVLVPGPHILNGALDLLSLRITLGIARLGYASLVLAAIAAGLILGLHAARQTLSVSAAVAYVPLSVDVLAAGVASACFAVYFSMPYRLIGWPVAAGMLAHAAHWWLMTSWGMNLAAAAFAACLLVGTLLVAVAHWLRMTLAVAIGFASVVSFMPGSYLFRMLSGLIQLPGNASPNLLAATASNGAVAMLVVVGMAVGLTLPMYLRDTVLAVGAHRS
ncbi:threonine/serine exporter family protein [Mycobacterium sp. JS623]|uniref:threonine/serine exporter family protein n=1 Tax=Mycobacterium sp. JS623 TaxID=212767 RepID=UPI00214F3655|nr:threonine/serine exporter family protein [Mycobacterium sp. JS623]